MLAAALAFIRFFRDAAWLTPGRARLTGAGVSLAMLGAMAWLVATTRDGIAVNGLPIAGDFLSFWSAASLALAGRPEGAYDPAALGALQAAAFPTIGGYFPWLNPPVFLLLCLPFAALPYGVAVGTWLAATFSICWLGLRALLPANWAVPAVLGFPAVLINFRHGQSGFLSAGLFAAAAVLLDRRPVLAGACLGCLAYKPHLALVVPVALASAGRWRAFAAAGAALLLLSGASCLAFGAGTWRAFFEAAPSVARRILEEVGPDEYGKMVSLFAGLRLAAVPLGAAYAAQAALACAVAAALALALRRRPGGAAEVAAMAAAALLCSPYLYDYDLMVAAVPLAWVLGAAARGGFMPWEKGVLLLGFAWPLFARSAATASGLPLTPLVVAALLAVVLRRASGRAPAPRPRPRPEGFLPARGEAT